MKTAGIELPPRRRVHRTIANSGLRAVQVFKATLLVFPRKNTKLSRMLFPAPKPAVSLKQKTNIKDIPGEVVDWFLLATAGSCGIVLLWTSRTARVRHAHNLDLIMEKRVLESFAGRDAALSVAPAQPTEMRPDRWRKFVVIEGGKSVTRVGREARSVASAGMKTN